LYVFIIRTLSDDYLRGIFAAGKGRNNVAFVLRGWKPPHINELMMGVAELFDDRETLPNVYINPQLFRAHAVEAVPVFVLDQGAGGQRRLDGEISLEGAESWLRGSQPLPSDPVGPLMEIDEPDILSEIETRIADFDWKGEMEKAKQKALSATRGQPLPRAEKDQTYWVDISTVIKKDITLPDGRVVAKAGTVINPLKVVVPHYRYVFFDPADQSQIAIVKQWQQQYTNLKLIATELAPLSEYADSLIKTMGQMVFPSNRLLIQRFQIHSVPALVEHDNGLLKITVRKPHWGETAPTNDTNHGDPS
jgi:conjugal transfer pilus assembly protein TraW